MPKKLVVHRVLYPSMLTESWVEGKSVEEKDAQPTKRTAALRGYIISGNVSTCPIAWACLSTFTTATVVEFYWTSTGVHRPWSITWIHKQSYNHMNCLFIHDMTKSIERSCSPEFSESIQKPLSVLNSNDPPSAQPWEKICRCLLLILLSLTRDLELTPSGARSVDILGSQYGILPYLSWEPPARNFCRQYVYLMQGTTEKTSENEEKYRVLRFTRGATRRTRDYSKSLSFIQYNGRKAR